MNKNNSLRDTLRYIIYNGVAATSMFAMAGSSVVIAYAMLLGASPVYIGLIGNMEYISFFSYFIASYLINKGNSVKNISVKFSFVSRFFYLIIAMLAFFKGCSWVVVCLLFCLLMSNFVGSIAGGVFYPWMKSLLPKNILASFFAERFRWTMITNIIFYLIVAGFLYIFNNYFSEYMIYAYSLMFFCAFILGLYCVYTFTKVRDIEMERSGNNTFGQKIGKAVKNKSVIFMSSFLGLINFSVCFISPFITVYILSVLQFSMSVVILLTILSNVSYVLLTKVVAHKIKQFGCLSVILSGLGIYILSLFCFIACLYFDKVLVVILLSSAHVLLGMSKFTVELGTTNIQLLFVPQKDSSVYIAVINFVRACFATISGVVSGYILSNLEHISSSQSMVWLLFWLIGIVCFASVFLYAVSVRRSLKC